MSDNEGQEERRASNEEIVEDPEDEETVHYHPN